MVSICTQTLDWNWALSQTLPTWLKYPADEIIIFDWGNGKESAFDIIKEHSDSRIKYIQNLEDIPYNKAIARNMAVKTAKNDIIFYMDSDIKILKFIPEIAENSFMQGYPVPKDNPRVYSYQINNKNQGFYDPNIAGTSMFWKKHYLELNGFDERMKGWGYQDDDFHERLIKLGIKRVDFPPDSLSHIDHDDNSRTKNLLMKDMEQSREFNIKLAKMNPWGKNFDQTRIKCLVIYKGKEQILTL